MKISNYLRQSKRRHQKSIIDSSVVFSNNDQIVGKDTLASMMEVSITCVERWIRAGMPVEQRGDQISEWIFNFNKVKLWESEY